MTTTPIEVPVGCVVLSLLHRRRAANALLLRFSPAFTASRTMRIAGQSVTENEDEKIRADCENSRPNNPNNSGESGSYLSSATSEAGSFEGPSDSRELIVRLER